MELSADERLKLTQIEGQVWLTIYRLLMDRECQQKYELSNYSKATILKVCSLVTNYILHMYTYSYVVTSLTLCWNKYPNWLNYSEYLHQLSIMNLPAMRRDLILEQVTNFSTRLLIDSISS